MAEAVLKHQISLRPHLTQRLQINVDSAGTGAYHAGEQADDRTIAVCRQNDVPISCVARKVTSSDYSRFDFMLAMDQSNLQSLQNRAPRSCRAHISLFGAFDPSRLSPNVERGPVPPPGTISDPYYGGSSGFQDCFEQCVKYSNGFLDVLEGKSKLPEE